MHSTVCRALKRPISVANMSRNVASVTVSPVRKVAEKSRFEMQINSTSAFAEYKVVRKGVYLLHESFVPEAYQGAGYGRMLAKGVFDIIVEEDQKMIVTCEFLRKVYEENSATYRHVYLEQ